MWDPARDLFLPVPLSPSDPALSKAVARAELRRRLDLQVVDPNTGEEQLLVGAGCGAGQSAADGV